VAPSPGSASTYRLSSPVRLGTRFALLIAVPPGFAKEEEVSLKNPFGGWTESARFDRIMRRMRTKEITRVWHSNRPAAIVITVGLTAYIAIGLVGS